MHSLLKKTYATGIQQNVVLNVSACSSLSVSLHPDALLSLYACGLALVCLISGTSIHPVLFFGNKYLLSINNPCIYIILLTLSFVSIMMILKF